MLGLRLDRRCLAATIGECCNRGATFTRNCAVASVCFRAVAERDLSSHACSNTGRNMLAGLLVTVGVSVLALAVTFAVALYIDARAERPRR